MAKHVDPEFLIAAACKIRVPLYVQIISVVIYILCYLSSKLLYVSLNWLPVVNASFFILGLVGLLSCVRVPRPNSFARVQVLNTLLLSLIAISCALSNPGSQAALHSAGYWIDELGVAARCRYKDDASFWCNDKDTLFSIIIFANIVVYNNVFIFSLRFSILSSFLNSLIYFSILRWMGWFDAFDIVLFVFMCVLSVAVKQILEMQEQKLYSELQRQRQETVQEKVLRCAAEFEREQLLDGTSHIEPEKSEDEECKTTSAESAPAVIQRPTEAGSVTPHLCSGNTCLPGVAEVWKEGHAVPTCVQEMAPGDRVLCLDEWTRSVGYVAVAEVHITDADQTSWMTVTLEDGSMQQMSSDHPVYPHAHGQPCQCSRASDLKPGYHTLPVFRLMHVLVKTVEPLKSDTTSIQVDVHPKKASLSLTDNQRYTVLACCGTEQGGQTCMAVGAVAPQGGRKVICQNSFINVVNEEPSVLRRCSSEPALHLHASSMAQTNAAMLIDNSIACNSSTVSSGESANILMWGPDICKASFVANLNAKHVPSAGSYFHESGNCRPCLFQTRLNKQWAPCWKSTLCDHCHSNGPHMRRPSGKKK